MITLYWYGPAFGLPDGSPFCVKADVLLKMSGLPYQTAIGDRNKSPKSKLPYVNDGGIVVPDSTFIRWHLEQEHGIDFDRGLSATERAQAWAFEKLCEDHLYWATVDARWMVDANFNAGPIQYFEPVPRLIRPLITRIARREVKRNLYGHGFGRHSRANLERLATHGYDALAAQLGDRPFLMGNEPCGVDATVFAWVGSALSTTFQTPIRTAVEGHANLVAYRDRCLKRWYPAMVAGKV